MNEYFQKGEDVTVWLGGSVLGGVTCVKTEEENREECVYEFLSRRPCERFSDVFYTIELTLNALRRGGEPCLDGDVLVLDYGGRREVFSDCRVMKISRSARAGSKTEYVVKFAAEERSVESD